MTTQEKKDTDYIKNAPDSDLKKFGLKREHVEDRLGKPDLKIGQEISFLKQDGSYIATKVIAINKDRGQVLINKSADPQQEFGWIDEGDDAISDTVFKMTVGYVRKNEKVFGGKKELMCAFFQGFNTGEGVITENGKEIKYLSPNGKIWDWEEPDNSFTNSETEAFNTYNLYKSEVEFQSAYNHNFTILFSRETLKELEAEAERYEDNVEEKVLFNVVVHEPVSRKEHYGKECSKFLAEELEFTFGGIEFLNNNNQISKVWASEDGFQMSIENLLGEEIEKGVCTGSELDAVDWLMNWDQETTKDEDLKDGRTPSM